jgi:hypothetical protein
MSLRDPLIALEQMRDHASEAMSLLAGKGRTDLEADRVLSLAVVLVQEPRPRRAVTQRIFARVQCQGGELLLWADYAGAGE